MKVCLFVYDMLTVSNCSSPQGKYNNINYVLIHVHNHDKNKHCCSNLHVKLLTTIILILMRDIILNLHGLYKCVVLLRCRWKKSFFAPFLSSSSSLCGHACIVVLHDTCSDLLWTYICFSSWRSHTNLFLFSTNSTSSLTIASSSIFSISVFFESIIWW